MISTGIALSAMFALIVAIYSANRGLEDKIVRQKAEIERLGEELEVCADEIEDLNQQVIDLSGVDESLYFEMARSFGPDLTVIKGGKK